MEDEVMDSNSVEKIVDENTWDEVINDYVFRARKSINSEEGKQITENLLREQIKEEMGPYIPLFQSAIMKELGLLGEEHGTVDFLRKVIDTACLDKKIVAFDEGKFNKLKYDLTSLEERIIALEDNLSQCALVMKAMAKRLNLGEDIIESIPTDSEIFGRLKYPGKPY